MMIFKEGRLMEAVEPLRSAKVAREIADKIRKLEPGRKVKFMHVCGTASQPRSMSIP